jgi:ElaB/YqjD/DUF883 family membrane-anchored ribosome-binding protein
VKKLPRHERRRFVMATRTPGNSKRRSSGSRTARPAAERARTKVKEAVGKAEDVVRDAGDRAAVLAREGREKVGEMAREGREKLSHSRHG